MSVKRCRGSEVVASTKRVTTNKKILSGKEKEVKRECKDGK